MTSVTARALYPALQAPVASLTTGSEFHVEYVSPHFVVTLGSRTSSLSIESIESSSFTVCHDGPCCCSVIYCSDAHIARSLSSSSRTTVLGAVQLFERDTAVCRLCKEELIKLIADDFVRENSISDISPLAMVIGRMTG